MAEQNGKLKIGRSARLLGVRPNIDINIQQIPIGCLEKQSYLLPQSQRKLHGDPVLSPLETPKECLSPYPSKG